MAPSTPPPPSRLRLAALTMALTSSVVMSATRTSSRVLPISAVTRGSPAGIFLIGLGCRIDGGLRSDSIEMRHKEILRRLPPVRIERLEILVVVVHAAGGIGGNVTLVEHDAMQPQLAQSAGRLFLRQTIDSGERAQLGKKRRIETDLADAADDVARRR